jgi:hypothetical protein
MRGGQSMGTVGGMVDRMEGGDGESKVETDIGGSRRLPDRKGEPGLRSVESGGCSPQVGGKVRKFVSVYETKMKLKSMKSSAGETPKKKLYIHIVVCVCGQMKTQFDISSPVKWLDMGNV